MWPPPPTPPISPTPVIYMTVMKMNGGTNRWEGNRISPASIWSTQPPRRKYIHYILASKWTFAIKSLLCYIWCVFFFITNWSAYFGTFIFDHGLRYQRTASINQRVNYRNTSCCEVSPFSFFVCFHYYFHTVGLLWSLLQITAGGKCNKGRVLILSVWFHQASYTPRKKNYRVLLIASATDNSTDKPKFAWLAGTLLLGYISSKWFAWSHRSSLDKNCNIWLLCEREMEDGLFLGNVEIWDIFESLFMKAFFFPSFSF